MNRIPLASRLKRRSHLAVGLAQDILVQAAYDSIPDCVMHGGTAIWRCYRGGRFSEDVDVYLASRGPKAVQSFRDRLASRGMRELKFKATGRTIFAKYDHGGVPVSFEAALRAPPPSVLAPYEMLDGAQLIVRTLSPEGLVLEKAGAYVSRRKVRDLYDLFFLLSLVSDAAKVRGAIQEVLRTYQPPVDEAQLRATIIAGAAPTAKAMLDGIQRWARRFT